ncbi:Hemocyanin B chain-like 4, partial [Homarus americanus]
PRVVHTGGCSCRLAKLWPGKPAGNFQNDDPGVSKAKKQQDVNHLVERIYERIRYPDLQDIANAFNPEADTSMYSDDGQGVHHLMNDMNDHILLERHHLFSLFNSRHRREALMLFDVFMHCKTWTCFVNNAAYFREHMNEGEFLYAFYTAVVHSDLGTGVVLHPLYEITPHMFTNSEIIHKAYTAKMTQTPGRLPFLVEGLLRLPSRLQGQAILLGLSNWLDVVDELHWERIIREGFAPHTSYKYGGEFPARPDNVHFEDVDGVARVRDMIISESRIRDAIAHGYVTDKDGNNIDIMNDHGIDVLGDILESSRYSPNAQYYGALHNTAHIMLGRQGDPHGKFNMPPGVMEHFETATRDPSFFRLHKYMDNIFKEHKNSLPIYTREDLEFTGVAVDDIAIEGELKTYFEQFEFSIANAVDKSDAVEEVAISTLIPRLNHHEFTYKIDVNNNNDEDVLATMRIYLCPKNDANGIEFTWDEGRWYCIEMDKFWKKLAPGKTNVMCKSSDSSVTTPDSPSLHTQMEKADEALISGDELDLHEFERSCGLPHRMLLPKGQTNGMEFLLLVAVTNGEEDKVIEHSEDNEHGGTHSQCGIRGEKYPDKKPMGYPLDRHIPDKRLILDIPNIKTTTVKVFHELHQHEDH